MSFVPTLDIRRENISPHQEATFWSFVKIDWRPDACWEWTGKSDSTWSARMKLGRSRAQVPRVAYALYWGRTPRGLYVCHHCDNPVCVRQEHLYLGTPRDNADDRVRRGRCPAGANVGTSKLSEAEVLRMREHLAAGASLGATAMAFGVSKKLVLNIKRGTAWAHLLSSDRAA